MKAKVWLPLLREHFEINRREMAKVMRVRGRMLRVAATGTGCDQIIIV
jgi:hypothetical protein